MDFPWKVALPVDCRSKDFSAALTNDAGLEMKSVAVPSTGSMINSLESSSAVQRVTPSERMASPFPSIRKASPWTEAEPLPVNLTPSRKDSYP